MPSSTKSVCHETFPPASAAPSACPAPCRTDTAAGADPPRRLPPRRAPLQPRAEDGRVGQPCGRRTAGRGPHGLPAPAVARRQFLGGDAPQRGGEAVELRGDAPAGADALRWRGGPRGGRRGVARERHRPLRRGVHPLRGLLFGRVHLLEPLGHGGVRRLDAPLRGADSLAQGGGRLPL